MYVGISADKEDVHVYTYVYLRIHVYVHKGFHLLTHSADFDPNVWVGYDSASHLYHYGTVMSGVDPLAV